jgi:hypothetical protein
MRNAFATELSKTRAEFKALARYRIENADALADEYRQLAARSRETVARTLEILARSRPSSLKVLDTAGGE